MSKVLDILGWVLCIDCIIIGAIIGIIITLCINIVVIDIVSIYSICIVWHSELRSGLAKFKLIFRGRRIIAIRVNKSTRMLGNELGNLLLMHLPVFLCFHVFTLGNFHPAWWIEALFQFNLVEVNLFRKGRNHCVSGPRRIVDLAWWSSELLFV